MNLAPSEIFNPSILWLREKERMRRELSADAEVDATEDPEAEKRMSMDCYTARFIPIHYMQASTGVTN